jgi:hypothetical protein
LPQPLPQQRQRGAVGRCAGLLQGPDQLGPALDFSRSCSTTPIMRVNPTPLIS